MASVVAAVGLFFLWRDTPETRRHLIPLGERAGFYGGETMLIGLSWLNTGLFLWRARAMDLRQRRLLALVIGLFLAGMFLATAKNLEVSEPFFAWHALWHVVAGFGFLALWALNDARYGGAES